LDGKEDDMDTQITLFSVLVCPLALVAVPGAHAERAYTDPAGDSGTAPDVTAVRAAHDAARNITFTATTNQPLLAADATVYVYVDADRNATTGLPVRGLGVDYFFSHDGQFGTGFLAEVSGNYPFLDFQSSLLTGYVAGTLTARINRSDLGDTEKLAFLIEAERDDENDATVNDADFAPDAAPFYEYSLASLALTVGKPAGITGKPTSGKTFVVAAPVTRSDGATFTAATVACKARVGSVSVSATRRIASRSARCAMKITRGAKGKMLRGSLTVSAEDAPAVTSPFAYRIG
jgi:hypothetical protein